MKRAVCGRVSGVNAAPRHRRQRASQAVAGRRRRVARHPGGRIPEWLPVPPRRRLGRRLGRRTVAAWTPGRAPSRRVRAHGGRCDGGRALVLTSTPHQAVIEYRTTLWEVSGRAPQRHGSNRSTFRRQSDPN